VRKKPTPAFARVIIPATPNANSTCSGTAIAMNQSVFFTAPVNCGSLCSMKS